MGLLLLDIQSTYTFLIPAKFQPPIHHLRASVQDSLLPFSHSRINRITLARARSPDGS